MSPIDWVAFAVFAGFMVAGAVKIRLGGAPPFDEVSAAFPWSPVAWRAYVRCLPATVCTGGVMVLTFMVTIIFPKPADGHHPLAVIAVVGPLGLSGLAVLSVVLFNRPRFLVARDLRDKPGVVAELLQRRRPRR